MPRATPLLLTAPLLTAALLACTPPSPQTVRRNGTWSDDGAALLIVESQYRSPNPGEPYFATSAATDWEIVLSTSDGDLAATTEVWRQADPSQDQGGGALYEPVFWLRDAATVVLGLYGEVRVVDLTTGQMTAPRLPDALAAAWFGPDLPSADGLLTAYAPSPDGQVLAVFYSLATLTDPLAPLHYRHGVGFFDLTNDGAFLAGAPLTEWNDTPSSLVLDPTRPQLPVDVPTPPPISPWQRIAQPTRFLWTQDSAGVVVIDAAREPGEVASGALILADHPTDYTLLGPTDLVPMAALATTGGPTHPDGRTLVVNEPPDNPNAVDLLILPTADWVPFSEVPQVPLADVTYAY